MPVIAVINRKGGSGKSTIATHLAAHFAHVGQSVMLGDVDQQQSAKSWLRRRSRLAPASAPAIQGWIIDKARVARPPAGTHLLVLDTPGGLAGLELARLVMWCDVILLPLCDSRFDRESAAECHAELRTLPRIAGGRCAVGAVGMRIDRRTRGDEAVQAWAAEQGLPYLGSLRNARVYVDCAERGLTVFDMPPSKAAADLAEWAPVLAWVQQTLAAVPARPAAVTPAGATGSAPVAAPSSAPVTTTTRPVALGRRPAAPRQAQLSMPASVQTDLSSLTLTGVRKPGFWRLLRRWIGVS